jgi:hypothetical protein
MRIKEGFWEGWFFGMMAVIVVQIFFQIFK